MSIVINDGFRVNAPKPADTRYLSGTLENTPYASVADVNAAISPSRRHIGLTVNVSGEEYWYKSGTSDGDLVLKLSGSTGLQKIDMLVSSPGQTIFTIPSGINVKFLLVNGETYTTPDSFAIVGTTLTRSGSFTLETSDILFLFCQ